VDYGPILPAALLALGLIGVIVTDLLGRGRQAEVPILVALASLGAAACAAILGDRAGPKDVWLGVLRPDGFGVLFTVFCCATGILTILGTMRGEAFRRPGGAFLVMILSSVLGMTILVQAVDLIALYLAFETVSIPAYVLVGMRRADRKANEASLKYVLFGAVSSAIMLYGLSMIVGLSGGTSFEHVAEAAGGDPGSQPMFIAGVVMVFAGFAFKISAVPFHFWAPDVYAGTPAAVAGFLSVASKAAGFAALARIMSEMGGVVPDAAGTWTFLHAGDPMVICVSVAAVLSMTIGNLAALRQTEIKRLLAWSSIAHAGYVLLALAVWSKTAAAALVLYLIAYMFMNLAAFFIGGMVIREKGTGDLSAFVGLGRSSPRMAVALAIVLFSLTGLPPLFGFVAKFGVFYAVIDKGYILLAVIGLVNGALSLYYYAKIVAQMFLVEPDAEAAAAAGEGRGFGLADGLLCAVLVVPLLVFGILWADVWQLAVDAAPLIVGGG
jgi:NADH-quinone oxidoreductase subunit N